MTYYRMRDIKTPPFAYVLNKEEVIQSCTLCQMPFQQLEGELKVEICTTESQHWETRIVGKPMMADHWLVGDEAFVNKMLALMPNALEAAPIQVVSWLTRTPLSLMMDPGSMLRERKHTDPPAYFYLKPTNQISLDPKLLQSFPPIKCCQCHREIPDIPIDFQPVPDPGDLGGPAASLKDLHLEGYDYLFHESVIDHLEQEFPEMILEPLAWEPLTI